MKKILLFLLLLAAVPAMASIKPATAYTVSNPGGVQETDAYVTVQVEQLNFSQQTVTVVFAYGTATLNGSNTTAFTASSTAPTTTLAFNATTGTWGSSTGLSGTLTTAQLTVVQNILAGTASVSVNTIEGFAVGVNLFGANAVEYPWAAGMIP